MGILHGTMGILHDTMGILTFTLNCWEFLLFILNCKVIHNCKVIL